MNRRNFFNKLGGAVLGCYLALGIEKVITPKEWIPNSEYENAEYTVYFMGDINYFKSITPPGMEIVFKRSEWKGELSI